jgi:hypothetical protein
MSLSAELSALAGVVLGAALTFAVTYLTERASRRRNQVVRWDERRLTAYADYSHAVKDMVALSSRLAAGQGIHTYFESLTPSQENLAKLAEAGVHRTAASETLRLLADPETMTAATAMTECAWELEWLARRLKEGDSSAWHTAYARYEQARDHYITCARQSLQVSGTYRPAKAKPPSNESNADTPGTVATEPNSSPAAATPSP